MYFKVVINSREQDRGYGGAKTVRYLEADDVRSLFRVLEKYYGIGSHQNDAASLGLFKTVGRDEFDSARALYQGALH